MVAPAVILGAFVCAIGLDMALRVMAEALQARHLATLDTADLADLVDLEQLRSAVLWHKATAWSMAMEGVAAATAFAVLATSGVAATGYRFVSDSIRSEIVAATVFILLAGAVLALAHTPFAWWRGVHIPRRTGYQTGSIATFTRDRLQGFIDNSIFTGLLALIVLSVHAWLGTKAWLLLAFTPALTYMGTLVIRPGLHFLFAEPTPLREGPMRDAIVEQLNEMGYEPAGVYIVDDTNDEGEPSVAVDGFGRRKRIGIGESLIGHLSINEVRTLVASASAVLADWLEIMWGTLMIGPILILAAFLLDSLALSHALGASETLVGLNLLALILLPIDRPGAIISRTVERRLHLRAIARLSRTSHGPVLSRMLRRSRGAPMDRISSHPFYRSMRQEAPTITERIRILERGSLQAAGSVDVNSTR